MSVEAGVSLENDKDDIRRPAHKSQNHTAAQEEPVIRVVVHQALQRMRDQSLAQRDLVGDRRGGEEDKWKTHQQPSGDT